MSGAFVRRGSGGVARGTEGRGTTPIIVAALIATTGSLMMPAYYLMFAALCGGLATLAMGETARRSLRGAAPTVESQAEAREVAGED